MTVVLDASGLFAQIDRGEPMHESVNRVLVSDPGPFYTTELVVTEVDHLVLARLDIQAELRFARDIVEETFKVECLSGEEWRVARDVVRRYRDLELGLVDASLVVLARRYGTRRILTLDERGFRAIRPLQGGSFTILPADAS